MGASLMRRSHLEAAEEQVAPPVVGQAEPLVGPRGLQAQRVQEGGLLGRALLPQRLWGQQPCPT
jgi:hypothetical protein